MKRRLIAAAAGVVLGATGCVLGQTAHPDARSAHKNMAPTGAPGEGPKEIAARVARQRAHEDEIYRLDEAGIAALKDARYAEAEADERQSVAIGLSSGRGIEVLAAALDAQGKTQEALQAYRRITDMGDVIPRNELPYARLLLETGHWPQAVEAYEKQLPYNGDGGMMQSYSDFSPDAPRPAELTAAIHIEMGLTESWDGYHGGRAERLQQALAQFQRALALEPNWAPAHLFYGRQLQRMGRRAEAQAAFRQAARLGQGDVKAAAQQSLKQ